MGNSLEDRKNELLATPKDYTFKRAEALLTALGYTRDNKGKTSGSRVRFIRDSDNKKLLLHKPHPKDVMPLYATRYLLETLKGNGDI